MKGLIQHQTIRVDNHYSQKGVGERDRNWHIDKEFTEKRLEGRCVEIYIGERPPEFKGNFSHEEKRKVISEIKKALKDKQKLRYFADIVERLFKKWSLGDIRDDEVRSNASKIADIFGLNPNMREEFIKIVAGKMMRYVSLHTDENKNYYWIEQSKDSLIIGPGKFYLRRYLRR